MENGNSSSKPDIPEFEKKLLERIRSSKIPLRIMHVCGTHERTIAKYGLRSVLPDNIEVISGPGCPVCVTPEEDINIAIALAKSGATVITFGDMMRVPGSAESLLDAKSEGADVRMVYSIDDAVALAEKKPELEVVFFGIGFETTVPANAAALLRETPENFSLLTSQKKTPPAIELLARDANVDAFIAPGHVATIIGTKPFEPLAEKGFPVVVSGFEVGDILLGISLLQAQIEEGISRVDNGYPRAVKPEGNQIALKMMEKVFETSDSEWRGIGKIANSGLVLRKEFEEKDAAKKHEDLYASALEEVRKKVGKKDKKRCICAAILTGKAKPSQCPNFGKNCSPKNPAGPCMVSQEGMCYNWFRYSREGGGKLA
ncbi:hydrogenase expression/formation protein HypD [Methanosarcina thermophila]|uniref:Hydrogenase expression/formation protein n=3 Tax=Methanosarcina thermophila TaxID=2210 RepID=A0A1I6XSH9_METTE|nr:hydrogenase formation protein HypD [Methanosarcina thermophila]ALK06665.1 MAG: hydrogenase [Methanosarcina sp. 795]AKB12879.1 [NiFe] hydrogenase metallocenter assembly protein HypD [Methanosarcina thermophila TM-1]AKB16500.1 [NiFe] hydrogenase metallocenter assembly protein HypD [Methanosarcina thermophila CHTI-55]NLU56906.1 hydrogenase formation protein HypD [Methanosarcina thermophila]SFT40891.1 hydrogenase expression/formation protein HypD [Methanosarcina thermophila]